ncbi:MAG: hypothetical protein HY770_07175, partial [Chitinivibrionia bacterium]|nr:hypothetical protein [Chitinivibrionia bacterium]
AAAFVSFDFESSSYFGSQREDLTITLSRGIVRILDRERDTFLEGVEADRFISEKLGITGDFKEIVGLAIGMEPDCGALRDLRMTVSSGGGRSFRAGVRGKTAKLEFSAPGGRLREIGWPLEVAEERVEELNIAYGWSNDGSRPESVLLSLDSPGWRIKLDIENADGNGSAGAPR